MNNIIFALLLFPSFVYASVQEVNSELARSVALELNAVPSLQKLIESVNVTSEARELLKNEVGSNNLSKKINFTSDKDSVLIQLGENKISVQLMNPVKGQFLIAGYSANLFGKSTQEKIAYVKKVIQSQSTGKKLSSLFSIIEPAAYAQAKSFQNVSPADLAALGISVTLLSEASRLKFCTDLHDEKIRQKKLKYFILLIDTVSPVYKPLSEEERRSDKEDQAGSNAQFLDLSEQFWCAQKPANNPDESVLGFNSVCDAKSGQVKTLNYATVHGVATITSDKKSELEQQISKHFSTDFKSKLNACCGNGACRNQINYVAPLTVIKKSESSEKQSNLKKLFFLPSGKQ